MLKDLKKDRATGERQQKLNKEFVRESSLQNILRAKKDRTRSHYE